MYNDDVKIKLFPLNCQFDALKPVQEVAFQEMFKKETHGLFICDGIGHTPGSDAGGSNILF